MTEAAFAYHEDVASRAIVKKSAAHKKNGSAVAKLGNKPMSWQEINKKHGPVQTYDLDSFMTFEEFKLLPPDLKVEYVNGLCKKWNIRICHVSEYLFKQGEKGLMGYLKIFDLYRQCTSSGEWTEESAEKFRKAVEAWENHEEPAEVVDNPEVPNIPKFMDWGDFKALSPDEKVVFINRLLDEYQIGCFTIDKELFGYGYPKVHDNLRHAGIYDQIHVNFRGGKDCQGSEYKAKVQRFHDDIEAWRKEPVIEGLAQRLAEGMERALQKSKETKKQETEVKAEEKTEEKSAEKTMETVDEPVMVISVPEDICDSKDFCHDDEIFPTTATSSYQFNPGIGLNEELESEPVEEAAEDPLTYHDFSFTASYISKGLNTDEFYDLAKFVKNKLVKVEITVTEMRDYLSKVRT